MGLVNLETLNRIKEERRQAYLSGNYGVSQALRALDSAIAQLEQIDLVTKNLELKVVEKG